MTEIAQEPWSWILYEEGQRRVLTVVIGGVGLTDFSVELTPDESAAWDAQGAAGIKDLVYGIQRTPDGFRPRKVPNPA